MGGLREKMSYRRREVRLSSILLFGDGLLWASMYFMVYGRSCRQVLLRKIDVIVPRVVSLACVYYIRTNSERNRHRNFLVNSFPILESTLKINPNNIEDATRTCYSPPLDARYLVIEQIRISKIDRV